MARQPRRRRHPPAPRIPHQDYFYPLWADDGGTSYTLRGTLLPDRAYDQSEGTGEEGYWVLPDFGWGYADNWSAEAMDPDHGNLFRIADAVDDAGNPADLGTSTS